MSWISLVSPPSRPLQTHKGQYSQITKLNHLDSYEPLQCDESV